MSAQRFHLQAALAVLLPVGLLAATALWNPDPLLKAVVRDAGAFWLFTAAALLLAVFEVRWLGTLMLWLRVRGNATAWREIIHDPVWRSRRRRSRFRLSTMALALLTGFVLTEAAFRLLNIRPAPIAPMQSEDFVLVDNTLNTLGIREAWDEVPPDDTRLRVALLGDSITYGYGVERAESFPFLLNHLLADAVPGGVLTINMGDPGTAPAEQLALFRRLADTLRPDVVVHVIYPNDIGLNLKGKLYDIYRIRDETLWFTQRSYVLYFAERQIRYWLAWRQTINYFRGGASEAERQAAWSRFAADMRETAAAVRADGATYAIVMFPWLCRLEDYLLLDLHDSVRDLAEELHAPYHDLLDVFADRPHESLRLSPANEHPNTLGHSLAADGIAAFLKREILPRVDRTKPEAPRRPPHPSEN